MIRATITAHTGTSEPAELTLQINDRSLGGLALQRQKNYVMTGNRRVQVVSGLITNRRRANAVAEDRHQLKLWEKAFRDMQTSGLAILPEITRQDSLRADFLALADDQRFICYTNERFGVYLHRDERLYRLQPIVRPGGAPNFFGLDFYNVLIAAEDTILILAPSFVDLFEAAELEEAMASQRQAAPMMARLSELAEMYGEGGRHPWLALQVQRVTADQSNGNTLSTKGKARRRFPEGLPASKVVRLANGNFLIPVPREDVPPPPIPEPDTRPRLIEPEERRVPLPGRDGNYPSASRTLTQSEQTATRLDRLKTKELTGMRTTAENVSRRLWNLFPGQKALSRITFLALLLVFATALLFAGKLISQSGDANGSEPTLPIVVVDPDLENGVDRVPLKTDYEIEWEVKANTLVLYSAPGSGRKLATVMRGETIWKLTEPENGWILVRLVDGRTGYVSSDMLQN